MDGGEQFLPEDEFLDQPGTSQAASSSRIHSEINVEETEAADNMYMTEDGMRYIGIDGEICYFEEEHIEVLDEPLDEVIVEGSENEAFEGEEAQPPPKNDEFKVVAPKIPADAEEVEPAGIMIQNIPQQGLRRKRTRQYGSCSCQECGQTFINQARLERHLVTHQVFGSFLCPLCGKVFKYEYNLFHHWRRACFELKEVMAVELRQDMEVNQLRMMVEDLAQKKPEIGPVELGISKSILFQTGPTARLEIPNNFQAISRRGNQCESCNVFIPSNHIRRHASLHQADSPFRPDDAMDLGGFICDLCGICYRFHHNLLSHWRSSCPEILANLPQGELCLDDEGLRDMVVELLVRAKPLPKDGDFLTGELSNHENSVPRSSRRGTMDDDEIVVDDDTYSLPQPSRSNMYNDRDTGIIFADDFGPDGVTVDGHGHIPSSERSKWRLKESAGKICSECGKIFANQGRLERHQMGTHSNFGSHQCILCGNRFKYEYNLLFHYRKSCPYTRAFIEESLRQQLNSNELRKIIRGIAQKKLPSKHTLPFPLPANMAIKGEATRAKKSERVCPPQSLHIRPDLSDREPKACPVCEVIFYGTNYLNRHIQTAHGMNPEELSSMQPAETRVKRYEKIDRHTATPQVVEEDDPDDLEPPPKLMPQIADKPEIFYRFVDQLGKRCSNISKEALDIIRDYLKSEGAEAPEVIIQTEDETKEYEVEIMGTFDSEDVKTVVLNVKSRFKNVDDADEKNEIVFEETVGEEIDEEPVSMEEIAV